MIAEEPGMGDWRVVKSVYKPINVFRETNWDAVTESIKFQQ